MTNSNEPQGDPGRSSALAKKDEADLAQTEQGHQDLAPPAEASNGKRAIEVAARGKLEAVTERSKQLVQKARSDTKPTLSSVEQTLRQPTTGAAMAGAIVAMAASTFGVAPAVLGGAAGYVVYRQLRHRQAEGESTA
jgi:hypothetical protein